MRAHHSGAVWVSALFVLAAGSLALAQQRSLPLDCLPDALASIDTAEPSPEARFGATYLPGIVLGPPGDSAPNTGTSSVASLGFGGSLVYEFVETVIEDRPGPDFIVFENAFFQGAAPENPEDHYAIFTEAAFVEVSADGVDWRLFPYDADALAEASGNWYVDRPLHQRLGGLAGITPTFSGNWTVADDAAVWDPAGQGGISGAGGDAFDLASVGLAEARFVRITDAQTHNGYTGSAEGADLDALVVLHGRPRPPAALDQDGDGLADAAELEIYGTLPGEPDSDFDGTDDGREIAGCRDPNSADTSPFLLRVPRLWLRSGVCTELRWSFTGTGALFDLVRGELSALAGTDTWVDLGDTICLVDDSDTWNYSCDEEQPLVGTGRFYLVAISGESLGRSSGLVERDTSGGCP